MKTQRTNPHHMMQPKPGFASVLLVVSVGLALLVILLMTYRNTIQSQKEQSNLLLRNDYLQREDAFLSALTNIIPNRAMRGMMDNIDSDSGGKEKFEWEQIFTDALDHANVHQGMKKNMATAILPASSRSANTAGTADSVAKFTVSSNTFTMPSASAPIIAHTGIDNDDFHLNTTYGKINAPKINFKYQVNPQFIAKRNNWTFSVSFAEKDADLTNVKREKKEYMISLYEIPAQLAINSASFTNFGQHDDGSNWSNITTDGGIFAGGVKTKGSFSSTDGIASRRGVELADDSNPLASTNTERNEALYKGATDTTYSSSSDGGHVAFVPILPVIPMDLYDAASNQSDPDYLLYTTYLDEMKIWTAAGSDPTTRPVNKLFYTRSLPVTVNKQGSGNVSALGNSTAWKYYSRGANQCEIVLIFDGTTNEFRYLKNGAFTTAVAKDTIKVGTELVFPHDSEKITVNLGLLIAWLADEGVDMSTINSLCVNTDSSRSIYFSNAKDLTTDQTDPTLPEIGFTNGFSIVVNQMLLLDEDINVGSNFGAVPAPTHYPYVSQPLSLYAPLARYGNSSNGTLKIEVVGALGSMAEKDKNDAVNIGDLKVLGEETNAAGIKATLKSITNLSELPPVNMMNWMIVIQEVH